MFAAFVGIGTIMVTGLATQSNCRLYLVSQYSWGDKEGFYLDLEGSALAELPVILGAADGKNWRFISCCPPFALGRRYVIRAVVAPDGTRLFVDGVQVAQSEGTWLPHRGTLEVNYRPPWADEPGDWVGIVQRVLVTITRAGAEVERREFDFTALSARPVALQLFEPGLPTSAEMATQPGDTVTAEVTMRFESSDLRRWAPLIDRYGQAIHADWPEKVRSDEELQEDVAREDAELKNMPPSPDFDEYGGWTKAGWREEGTGFFRLVKHNGYWWLITPLGNPCVYLGVCSVPGATWETTPITGREFIFQWLPPKEEPWQAAWSKNQWGIQDGTEYLCFYTCNLMRKYGPDEWLPRATEQAVRRLKAWGFSGGGKWGAPASIVSVPVLHRWGTPNLARHPDVFDPEVRRVFRAELERQILPNRDNPRVLGWSLGNEYDEIVTPEEVRKILASPSPTPAKRAMVDYAFANMCDGSVEKMAEAWRIEVTSREDAYIKECSPPDEVIERLRAFYADRYYEFIYRTVKEIDPNHLYLGFWIVPGWWVNEEDWRLIAPHCDVIGYDRYSREFEDERLRRLKAETDKPVLCGEFSYPAWYDGARGFGRYGTWARDDAEAGELYERWVEDMARDHYCVGSIWFLFRDQPLTGRGPGRGERLMIGEHFAFGLVTETDRLKWPLVRRMREANLQAASWRMQASQRQE